MMIRFGVWSGVCAYFWATSAAFAARNRQKHLELHVKNRTKRLKLIYRQFYGWSSVEDALKLKKKLKHF